MSVLRSVFPRLTRSSQIAALRAYSARAAREDMGEGEKVIYDKLNKRFPGKQLEVQDVSGTSPCLTHGRSNRTDRGAGGCGSFYAIMISSPEFSGLSMVKQHKLVNDCLKEDIAGIHGLQVSFI